ncbi:putative endoglucanase [Aspergillus aculeatinus CBS 121060]|uniref:xyloglucan-specific endo-beta-1,4-glucanase n=3 Tax=Aspergillus TaxID=5052 RepID=A0A8G1RH01_9EURO|nr:xyloglucan-specific endo-beta-1,4-glucanase precursor [Aspergillus brunneoviolaceus CBS 621.78]XP_025504456.1 xyloglucan-specific endo-beta-1,4-glucanase precursor [Aspergillus aculeatinus CBS 121060]XP_040796580.1 xyloglucan-specific endo-beta-1,4-glucanase precursor [Aspergillus fijiensis CBS 313.89]RAH45726.1 xyloglucan-specific endo-beta-1,4-glucanase precursor [Aspergillus brunneoviolaceus CBS 621.78]RAH70633.1 xyloglucan-specific endo-beta-1,4-glucanase precursor [Aspergillus aculeatin
MKLSLLSLATLASAASLQRRSDFCGQWDTATAGDFTLYNDLWGESAGTGSQCTGVDSYSGDTIAWHTSWSWSGGSSSVKSYANAALTFTPTQLNCISSIPTTWKWSYSGSSIVADVAYDTFLAETASGSSKYEIMVWLAALGGAGPISSTGSTIATPTIAGVNWKLYSGPNGDTTVYSFVADSTTESFSGDLNDFFTYLVDNEGVSDELYLTTLEAGTEPFTGSNAKLTVSEYSISIE